MLNSKCQGHRSRSRSSKGQIHLIGYNFSFNCHRDFKLGSYFSLWKATPNRPMTLTLTFDLDLEKLAKVKIFETWIKENSQMWRWKSTKMSNSLKVTLTLKILSKFKSCGIGDYCWRRFAIYECGASSCCCCYYYIIIIITIIIIIIIIILLSSSSSSLILMRNLLLPIA